MVKLNFLLTSSVT